MKPFSRPEYDLWLKNEVPEGTCTFCQWQKYQIVIREFKEWLWIQNRAPYWYHHTMFIPKRHFIKESEMNILEMAELLQIKEFAFNTIVDAKLVFPSGKDKGKPVEKFVYFHRYRINRFDIISGTMRPDHFHDHFSPDIDHRWDSTLDEDAYKFPITDYLKI